MAPTVSPSVIVSGRSPASVGRNMDRAMRLRGEYDLSTMASLSETLTQAIALDDADTVVDRNPRRHHAVLCRRPALRGNGPARRRLHRQPRRRLVTAGLSSGHVTPAAEQQSQVDSANDRPRHRLMETARDQDRGPQRSPIWLRPSLLGLDRTANPGEGMGYPRR
jgi:hypothetical protein